MSLIKCEECGKEISDKAEICPNCGNPMNKNNTVKIAFPPPIQGQLFNTGCLIIGANNNILAECKRGEIAEFLCNEPQEIIIKLKSSFFPLKTVVYPNKKYRINIRTFGNLGISEVDLL